MIPARHVEDGELIACVDCGTDWLLTPGNRQYFVGRGLEVPKRCPQCRKAKRERSERGDRSAA